MKVSIHSSEPDRPVRNHTRIGTIAVIMVNRSILILALAAAVCAQTPRDWTHFVRIGGNSLRLDRVDQIVSNAEASHVFGIETDNDIPGRYQSFLDPNEKLNAIRAVAAKAHAAGNYAFVYIAGLECITDHAGDKPHTLAKDHPDWLQRKISGEPAVFRGGAAFWIAAGDEDVWISPYATGWRKIYMERVRQIAATGIDGVYVDIPYWMTHFDGWEDSWASFDDYTVAAFKKKTGLDAKTDLHLGDFHDARFRKWVDFRIETITEFMKEIDSNVKSVNPKCETIAEIYPGIEEEVVRVGSDVYRLYGVVDTIAHEYEHGEGDHMASSKGPGDWFDYLAGMSSFRAFAAGKPSWMLGYSWDGANGVEPREAMKNLFLAQIMVGANVWDARGHVMSGSNDMPTRTQVFQWIQEHEKTIYLPRMPINPVGVYFSPATRDYFARDFMKSYKGVLELLMKSHVEFQIVTPRTLADFRGRILILPDVRCLGEREIASLKSYADSGRLLAATAQTGSCDESGAPRNGNSIREALGSRLNYRSDAAGEFIPGLLRAANFQAAVQIESSPLVFAQAATVDGTPHVFLANFDGLEPNRKLTQTPQTGVRVTFLAGRPRKVRVLPFLGEVQEIPANWSDGRVACTLPPIDKGMVVWIE
jgi:hypothetical protein